MGGSSAAGAGADPVWAAPQPFSVPGIRLHFRSKELILIDTQGFARSEMDQAGDLAHFLASLREIDTRRVLPGSVNAADINRTVESI